jgi:hypothetical protein
MKPSMSHSTLKSAHIPLYSSQYSSKKFVLKHPKTILKLWNTRILKLAKAFGTSCSCSPPPLQLIVLFRCLFDALYTRNRRSCTVPSAETNGSFGTARQTAFFFSVQWTTSFLRTLFNESENPCSANIYRLACHFKEIMDKNVLSPLQNSAI